jgi:hypothetical protein
VVSVPEPKPSAMKGSRQASLARQRGGLVHPNAPFKRYLAGANQPRRKTMLKATFLAAILASMAISPAFAEDMCNDSHMKQMDGMITKMTDPAKQKEATAALDQSKAAMKAGNNAECMKYMAEAHKAMGM